MSNCQSKITFVKYLFLELKKCWFSQNYRFNILINKDSFALKYQLNTDKFKCYVKIVKVTYITI